MTIFSKEWYEAIEADSQALAETLKATDEKTRRHFYKAFENIGIFESFEPNGQKKIKYWSKKLNVSIDEIFSYIY